MRASFLVALRGHRLPVLILVDSIGWMAAIYFATALRFETLTTAPRINMEGVGTPIPLFGVLLVGSVAISTHILIAWMLRLHHGRRAFGSFEELFLLASVLVAASIAATAFNVLSEPPYIPRSTTIIATFIALVLCAWPRALWRVLMSQGKPGPSGAVSTPAIIVGAGDAGRQLVQSMQRDREQRWKPVGFIDDDSNKKHLRYRGLDVLGTTDQLARVASRTGANTVIVAIPSASSGTISRINDVAVVAGLSVKVLPSVGELLAGVHHTAVRDLEPEDLLGRHQIQTDLASIAGYLSGMRVLVTGAGGSIGSELCRQIVRFGPESLVILDRDESALHSLLLSMHGRADLESRTVVLADIRDGERMRQVFADHRPQVVFHAAALKHVNLLEGQASEAVKTNVFGTLNVLEASTEFAVERFVNISTDKAADPINVLGYTKRIAERLTAGFATKTSGIYISVRFGNVLGTSGSVLRTFAAQIQLGGPVTVTDPAVTRYFMTVDEAVQLVIQAAAIGRNGEALVLDMGDPVRIVEVAERLIEQSNTSVNIVFTGLKPGEKLHEKLFGSGEVDDRPVHPLVSHVSVPPVTAAEALDLRLDMDNRAAVDSIAAMSAQLAMPDQTKVRP
ncbi:FlaA1/EpsC-like NDP-sugar epimerase [Aeromicrobium panaciterrae]|uniref:FlaA1/EpsC-like NDP-sugar epimerase n=1 Tax=Aeromicrobium panaciterrae TaxID=363861 RepID=A0ABU1UL74_9ACTN|nr:nucleoside-diphosphate sugar epimerase/dehydratase [Aeromicrobium panaciterrae]MDR7085938.1 FlaA1/EpsC-like NDP-sugar epimerase [Aeromicrobium panaciterrae]